MNARTSRLRSPIKPITLTSATLCSAIAPSSVLLPTPLPPKMPMRWPLPQGSMTVDGADTGRQRLGDVLAFERTGRRLVQVVGLAPLRLVRPESRGWPNPSSTRPMRRARQQSAMPPAAPRSVAQPHSSGLLEGHRKDLPVPETDHLRRIRRPSMHSISRNPRPPPPGRPERPAALRLPPRCRSSGKAPCGRRFR